jgi:hypothetical protein
MVNENQGVAYENKLNRLLKKYKLQSNSFRGAGTDQTRPDCQLLFKDNTYFVEVKHSPAKDFGQIPLHYDVKKKWIFSENTGVPDLADKLVEEGVVKSINKQWKDLGPPRKFVLPSDSLTQKDRDYDKKTFSEIFVDVPIESVAEYYNSKDVFYIQIGNYGFYYLGKNPMKLKIPEFKVPLQLRVRFKPKNSTVYSFMSALQIKKGNRLTKSNFDLENIDDLKFLQSLGSKK